MKLAKDICQQCDGKLERFGLKGKIRNGEWFDTSFCIVKFGGNTNCDVPKFCKYLAEMAVSQEKP